MYKSGILTLFIAIAMAGCNQFNKKPVLAILSTHIIFSPSDFEQATTQYDKYFHVRVYDPSNFNAVEVSAADLVLGESLGARVSMLQPQIDSIKSRTKILFVGTPGVSGNMDEAHGRAVKKYWDNANIQNFEGLLSYVGKKIFNLNIPLKNVIEYPHMAIIIVQNQTHCLPQLKNI